MQSTLIRKPRVRPPARPKEVGQPESLILEKLQAGAKNPEELIALLAQESGIDEPKLKDGIMRLLEDRRIRFDLSWDLYLPRPTRQ